MDSSDESESGESRGEEERRKIMNGVVWRMTTERKRVFLAVTHFVVDCFGRDIESHALAKECVQFERKRSRVCVRTILRGTERDSSPKVKRGWSSKIRETYIFALVFSNKFSKKNN